MTENPNLNAYIQAYEQLTPKTLSQLGACLNEQVIFRDPFNAVKGKQATLEIFEHMFATTQSPKFTVVNAAMQNDIALLYWHFDFILPSNQSSEIITGMSRIRFDKNGLVSEHIDHWDAGEQVYSKVPLLSWLIKLVRKRLAAH